MIEAERTHRCILIVIDSFGIGAMPDAASYGDEGADTAFHICQAVSGPKWPTLQALGLGNCAQLLGKILPGCEPAINPQASFGILEEKSPGKDTTTGHWELAGIVLHRPFFTFPPTYPSFPSDLVRAFEKETGRKVLGNKAASGTEIIQELGAEHIRTGNPICYTSADSVFQIAAHEEVIPLEELYRICMIARRLCDPLNVARVIARPFVGQPGSFIRTKNRKDFSLSLPAPSVLNVLQSAGVRTIGIGKIGNIFNDSGLDENYPDKGNLACLERTHSLVQRERTRKEFLFVNLVDTDMVYGHRRDVRGYFHAVSEIDKALNRLLPYVEVGDSLIVTADHGCDPTFRGTDHTREYVPLLVYQKERKGVSLGIRKTFADVASFVCQFFGLPNSFPGTSWSYG
ncbi:MAG: phosphopentomutase [Spirochaetes bacterium]|nr:phosphopentomutase [Spirochaetota bacterium]